MSIFHIYSINIFHHLKLEIALAIPALNKWKIETDNWVVQGLGLYYVWYDIADLE